MALTYGFYKSKNGDRRYSADDMGRLFRGLIEDGIFDNIGDHFNVVPSQSGLGITIKTGRAWLFDTWTDLDSEFSLYCDAADPNLDRIDTVVLRVDKHDDVRANSIYILTGIPAAEPVKANLTNTNDIRELALAYISITAGALVVESSDISNNVGTSECPYVEGAVPTIKINEFLTQWQADFDTWFANLQTQLSEDVAGNLQVQIDGNDADILALQTGVQTNSDNIQTNSDNIQTNSDNIQTNSDNVQNLLDTFSIANQYLIPDKACAAGVYVELFKLYQLPYGIYLMSLYIPIIKTGLTIREGNQIGWLWDYSFMIHVNSASISLNCPAIEIPSTVRAHQIIGDLPKLYSISDATSTENGLMCLGISGDFDFNIAGTTLRVTRLGD